MVCVATVLSVEAVWTGIRNPRFRAIAPPPIRADDSPNGYAAWPNAYVLNTYVPLCSWVYFFPDLTNAGHLLIR